MAQDDPTFQLMGPQYLTAPDGTMVPDQGGIPRDVTGLPLTVAPESNATQTGDNGHILAQTGPLTTVGGLTNMTASSVGRQLFISGNLAVNQGFFPIAAVLNTTTVQVTNPAGVFPDTHNGTTAVIDAVTDGDVAVSGVAVGPEDVGGQMTLSGCATPANNGTFPILSQGLGIVAVLQNPAGVFPDANSGAITWEVVERPFFWIEIERLTDFAPGDPLSYCAEQVIPLNVVNPTPGGAPTGGGVDELPEEAPVDAAQVLANADPVDSGEMAGSTAPIVRPGTAPAGSGATVGDVTATDPTFPVVFAPNSEFDVNTERDPGSGTPLSLAFGQSLTLPESPQVQTPEVNTPVVEPGVQRALNTSGRFVYPPSNPVVFSR